MKKLLTVGVSLMIILSLVGCSKKDDKQEDVNTPGIENNVDKDKQEENDGKAEDNKDESVSNDNNDQTSNTGSNQEQKPDVKPEVKPDTKPETKPESKPEVKPEAKPEAKPEKPSEDDSTAVSTVTNQGLADVITSSRDKGTNDAYGVFISADDPIAEFAFSVLSISEKDLSNYAISLSGMNTQAYCVAVVKPAEGKKDTVKAALEAYKKTQEDSFEQYLQDQYVIAQNAVITESGDYIVFAMCENASSLRDKIIKALK